MTFYRVSYSKEGGNSGGYSWHTTYRDAFTAGKVDYDLDPAEYNHEAKSVKERIETIVIKPTKAGILAALKRYASYPDNG